LVFSEIKEIASEVSEMLKAWSEAYEIKFKPSFNITGGEPFLRDDIFQIIEEIKGFGFEAYLLTNGILIDKQKADALYEAGINGVQISIEGPEDVHDAIRGNGSYLFSLKGVKFLLNAGIETTLNVTLSDVNAGSFMETITLSASLGVHRLGFSRLVPSGRGFLMLDNMLKRGKMREIYEKIFSLNTNGLDIVSGDPLTSQMSVKDNVDSGMVPLGGCAAGIAGLTILPDGTITPCRRLFVPIGNVRKDSLRDIWTNSSVLNMLRDKSEYKGKCGSCKRWANCRGCRAIAYAFSQSTGENNLFAEDPQCFIEE
jgi:radical SAM protein with 4Fe4S-binding SPASM domain